MVEIYKMISQEFDFNLLRQQESFGVKQYKDSIYRGELHEETTKRHGKGVIVYNNGRVYEGIWVNDKRHVRGYELYQNGNSY